MRVAQFTQSRPSGAGGKPHAERPQGLHSSHLEPTEILIRIFQEADEQVFVIALDGDEAKIGRGGEVGQMAEQGGTGVTTVNVIAEADDYTFLVAAILPDVEPDQVDHAHDERVATMHIANCIDPDALREPGRLPANSPLSFCRPVQMNVLRPSPREGAMCKPNHVRQPAI
jgi:hypothetical protein